MLEPHAAAGIALAVAAATVGGLCSFVVRRSHGVRSEKELIAALGSHLVAARPLALETLAEQLAAHWFRRGRPVLAVVGAGERTLVIDADFRSPALHRAFGVENRAGLAAFLEGQALVVTRFRAAVQPLERLREVLSFCRARVVGAVLSPT